MVIILTKEQMALLGLLDIGIEIQSDKILDFALSGLNGEALCCDDHKRIMRGKEIFDSEFKDQSFSSFDETTIVIPVSIG